MTGFATIRGLTLTQPWATLIANGHKRVETRGWSTKYRGWLAIHAAKGFPADARRFAQEERALGRLESRLPIGCVVAVARLTRVLMSEEAVYQVSALERHLGDYSAGRYAWYIEDVKPLPEPIPCKGALSLWQVPPEVHRRIVASLDEAAR